MSDGLAKNGMMETNIDERWMDEWVEWGIQSFEKSLRNHAKFDELYPPKKENKE